MIASNPEYLNAEALLQAIEDVRDGKVYCFRSTVKSSVPWYVYLSNQTALWNNFLRKQPAAVFSVLKIPSVQRAVFLWTQHALENYNLKHICDEDLKQAQEFINTQLQNWLDTIYYAGDAYLTAITFVCDEKQTTDLIVGAGVKLNMIEPTLNRLREICEPRFEFIDNLLSNHKFWLPDSSEARIWSGNRLVRYVRDFNRRNGKTTSPVSALVSFFGKKQKALKLHPTTI
jgi:hypothetical protein